MLTFRSYLLSGLAFGFCLFGATCGRADELRSPWESLPSECLGAVRIVHGTQAVELLRENTRLGTELLNWERWQPLAAQLAEEGGPWHETQQALEKYGITANELVQLLAGETGMALLAPEVNPETQVPLVVLWCEPGPELGERALAALQQMLDEEEMRESVRRVDAEVDGVPVMRLIISSETESYPDLKLPDDYQSLSEEDQSAALEKAYEEQEKATVTTKEYATTLVARVEGRLLSVVTLESKEEAESEVEAEAAMTVLARFIESQRSDGAGFIAAATSQPGWARLDEEAGVPLIEAVGDLRKLFAKRANADAAVVERAAKIAEQTGLNQLGLVAGRVLLDGNLLRNIILVAAPTPRQGLVSLIDQPTVDAEPPAWVPTEVLEYQHLSIDMAAAFRVIKELLVQQNGERVISSLGLVETQLQAHVGTDIEGLLSSIGNVHTVLRFTPDPPQEDELPDINERFAFVWQPRDAEVWNRAMEAIGTFAPLSARKLKATEEQGFRGWRFDDDGIEGGVVHGKGYLVFGLGRGVLERALLALNSPPDGTDALVGSPTNVRVQELLPGEPVVGFSVSHPDKLAILVHEVQEGMLESLESQWTYSLDWDVAEGAEDDDEAYEKAYTEAAAKAAEQVQKLRELLPDKERLRELFGVSASHQLSSEDGFFHRSVLELPK